MVHGEGTDMDMITDPNALTPWERRNGRWYKREDYHGNAYGVNGAKYRACRHLIVKAIVEQGVDHIVSASSVLSPQACISATLAEELGLGCTILVGASGPETAPKHPSIRIALEAGAELDTSTRVGYNPVIQKAGEKLAQRLGAWQLPYGITTPADASPEDVEAFLAVGGAQVANLPPELKTLVIPFGSGNTAAAVLWGIAEYPNISRALERIILVGVGPDRMEWLDKRLAYAGLSGMPKIEHLPLHGWFASYGDRMPETVDDIVMHPTYEGKVVRYLDILDEPWWSEWDGTTGLWIVGGPIT